MTHSLAPLGQNNQMSESVYPLLDLRAAALPLPQASESSVLKSPLLDTHARHLHDLRISVTDRCNFRCSYCMPKEVFNNEYAYLPHKDLLSFEEITRIAGNFVALGVRKIRLTGGEPLLRKNIEVLIEQLASLRTPDGTPLDLTLTTNGSLLERKAQSLKDAGLQRVTVSLDGLDDAVFRRMNDVDFPVQDVLQGIERAQQVGLGPVKVNMVVKRGTNEQEIVPMARHFRHSGVRLRFIEFMDVGATNGWRMDEVLPSADVLRLLQQEWPMVALEHSNLGETAQRWGYADAAGQHDKTAGEIGLISSVTQAFCDDCNRARLSTDGRVYLCLFAGHGYDLRTLLRDQALNDEQLQAQIDAIWRQRTDRYSQLRSQAPAGTAPVRRVEMSYIGG